MLNGLHKCLFYVKVGTIIFDGNSLASHELPFSEPAVAATFDAPRIISGLTTTYHMYNTEFLTYLLLMENLMCLFLFSLGLLKTFQNRMDRIQQYKF